MLPEEGSWKAKKEQRFGVTGLSNVRTRERSKSVVHWLLCHRQVAKGPLDHACFFAKKTSSWGCPRALGALPAGQRSVGRKKSASARTQPQNMPVVYERD